MDSYRSTYGRKSRDIGQCDNYNFNNASKGGDRDNNTCGSLLRSSRESQRITFTNADSTSSADCNALGRLTRGDSGAIERGTDGYGSGRLGRGDSGASAINVGKYSVAFRRWGSTNQSSADIDLPPGFAEIEKPPASKLVEEDDDISKTVSDGEDIEVSSIKKHPLVKDSSLSSMDRKHAAPLSVNEEHSSKVGNILKEENDECNKMKESVTIDNQLSSTMSGNNSYKRYRGGSADTDGEGKEEKAKADVCFDEKMAAKSTMKKESTDEEEEKKEAPRKRVPLRRDFTQMSTADPRAAQQQVDENDWARRNQGRNKVSDLVARFSNPANVSNATTNYKTEVGIGRVGQIRQNKFY